MVEAGKPEWWRGPWLRREDIEILELLSTEKAKSFELLLHQQARSNESYENFTVPWTIGE